MWQPYRNPKAFHDKAYQRSKLAPWDARWHNLSPAARTAYLTDIKGVPNAKSTYRPTVPASRFHADVLRELHEAGFVALQEKKSGAKQVVLPDDQIDFFARVRLIHRCHVLSGGVDEVQRFLNGAFVRNEVSHLFSQVHAESGELMYQTSEHDLLRLYLTRRYWPVWVVKKLRSPLAAQVLDKIRVAGGRVVLAEVPSLFPDTNPAAVWEVVEQLIVHLALFEDLDPATKDLIVGLLPSVLEDEQRAKVLRQRPPLESCAHPTEEGPEGGVDVPDLRTVLLELAAAPARLRQGGDLYQKEAERFGELLDPIPEVYLSYLESATIENRVTTAIRWARHLGFVHSTDIVGAYLNLSTEGQKWLALPVEQQYAAFFATLRDPPEREYVYDAYSWAQSTFLDTRISAVVGDISNFYDSSPHRPDRSNPLKEALLRSLHELPLGVFVPLQQFLDFAVFARHNPLLLGRDKSEVTVLESGRRVPRIVEQLEDVGKRFLREVLHERLIPLGCVQLGRDGEGQYLIARRPRLDAFFGTALPEGEALPADGGTRVVVQPDFSVMVLGLNPAPAAELLPFCERVKGRSGHGSLTLRITRDTVIRAVAAGMTGDEILARLRRHASTPVPANVLTEVRDWSAWIREISVGQVMLIRCPDAATAERVLSALGKKAERLGENLIGLSELSLNPALRQKLRSHGIVVAGTKTMERG